MTELWALAGCLVLTLGSLLGALAISIKSRKTQ